MRMLFRFLMCSVAKPVWLDECSRALLTLESCQGVNFHHTKVCSTTLDIGSVGTSAEIKIKLCTSGHLCPCEVIFMPLNSYNTYRTALLTVVSGTIIHFCMPNCFYMYTTSGDLVLTTLIQGQSCNKMAVAVTGIVMFISVCHIGLNLILRSQMK
jgi:hypothetical protein